MTEPPVLLDEARVQERCTEILAALAGYREYGRPPSGADGHVVHAAMIEVRSRLDLMEELLAELDSMTTAAKIVARAAEDTRQEAWDRRAVAPGVGGPRAADFSGKEERYARWNLDVLPQLRVLRQAQRLSDLVSSADRRARAMYRGLSGLQDELKTTLRYLPWEANMERF